MTPQQKYNRTLKGQYVLHKASAKQRGVNFSLSFDQWLEVWGDLLETRGCEGPESLQMCRYGDTGAYEVGNVYIAPLSKNRKDARAIKDEKTLDEIRHRKSLGAALSVLATDYGVSSSTISLITNRKGVYA